MLAGRPMTMGDTERHTMVRFGLKSTLVAKYLGIQYVGQNLQSEVCIAIIIIYCSYVHVSQILAVPHCG